MRLLCSILLVISYLISLPACRSASRAPDAPVRLRGASSYTPYDAFSMLWARQSSDHEMVWVSSGGEAGRLLVSSAQSGRRPDWILCTQGVVASLATQGHQVAIIATTYTSDDVILPVYRRPKHNSVRPSARSLFIPRTSIEFAFDRFLEREGLARTNIRVPQVEHVGFATIANLLEKPVTDPNAIEFAVLVEPFITHLLKERPATYEIGPGGLYEIHYSVVVRQEDLKTHRNEFLSLLRNLKHVDELLASLRNDETLFFSEVWGRRAGGKPELMPKLITFKAGPARLALDVQRVRLLLKQETDYLAAKYPGEVRQPNNLDSFVDPSLLTEVDPTVVK